MVAVRMADLRGGATRGADAARPLAPVEGSGSGRFRRLIYLRLPAVGPADEVRVDLAACVLRGVFQPLESDALTSAQALLPAVVEQVTVEEQATEEAGQAVLVSRSSSAPVNLVKLASPESGVLQVLAAVGATVDSVVRQEIPFRQGFARFSAAIQEPRFALRLGAGTLRPEQVEYLATQTPPAASVAVRDGGLEITLAAPRRLACAELRRSAVAPFTLHRIDGEAVAEQATTRLTQRHAVLADPQFASGAALVAGAGSAAGIALLSTRTILAPAEAHSEAAPHSSQGSVVRAPAFSQLPSLRPRTQFIDRQFVLRAAESLTINDLQRLHLTSPPTTPRLSLADPMDLEAAVPFWQLAGEVADGRVDAGAAFGDALGRHLAGRQVDSSGAIELALIIESDAPCRFALGDIAAPLISRLTTFADGQGKQVLRFAGRGDERRQLRLRLPAAGRVQSAELSLVSGLGAGGARLASPAVDQAVSNSAAAFSAGRWVGVLVRPSTALFVEALLLPLVALTAPAEVRFELQHDADGRPAGRSLAAGRVELQSAGELAWRRLPVAGPAALLDQPTWILVTTARGTALWHAGSAGGGEPAQRFDRADRRRPWRCLGSVGETSPAAIFLTPGPAPNAEPNIELSIANVRVPVKLQADDLSFDLRPALADLISDPADADGEFEVDLVLHSLTPGTVTVRPPLIELRPGV